MAVITIYCDASMCTETGAAAYGAWIKRATDSHRVWGPMKPGLENPENAEMAAMAYGLLAARRRVIINRGDMVVFVTDCEGAIRRLMHGHKLTPQQQKIRDYVMAMMPDGAFFKCNHVKGHGRSELPRQNYVNNLVHRMAIETMRQMRAEMLAESAKTC